MYEPLYEPLSFFLSFFLFFLVIHSIQFFLSWVWRACIKRVHIDTCRCRRIANQALFTKLHSIIYMYVLSFVLCSMFCRFNVHNMFIFFVIKLDFFLFNGHFIQTFQLHKKPNCVRSKMGSSLLHVILVIVLFELSTENPVSTKTGKRLLNLWHC